MPSEQDFIKYESQLQDVLGSKTVSFFTKNIIKEGLNKDPLDAVAYVELALKILKLKLNTVL